MSEPYGPSQASQRKTALIIGGALACGVLFFVLLFCGGVVAGVVHKGMQRPRPTPIQFQF